MIKWLRKLWRIVARYESDQGALQVQLAELEGRLREWERVARARAFALDGRLSEAEARAESLEKLIRDRTTIAADIGPGPRSENYAIVIGRYRGADYVQTFTLDADSLCGMIDQLRRLEHDMCGTVRRVDAPPIFRSVSWHA